MKFSDLNLSPIIINNLNNIGWTNPTEIQAECIPKGLAGKDVVGYAETGSGKTAAYCIPIIQHWLEKGKPAMYGLILLPSIELTCQVFDELEKFGAGLDLKVLKLIGGEDMDDSLADISKFDSHIVVATPGRLLMMFRHTVNIKKVFSMFQQLVIDEADKMMQSNCGEDLQKILYVVPKKPSNRSKSNTRRNDVFRQTQIFSATYECNIDKKFGFLLHNFELVDLSTPTNLPATLKQYMLSVSEDRKEARLFKLVSDFILKCPKVENKVNKGLIFVQNYADTRYYSTFFNSVGIPALQLNSKMKLDARSHHIAEFKAGNVLLLISTDVASRGLDVKDIVLVVNMNIPDGTDSYRHRAGRTARLGNVGTVVTFVFNDTQSQFLALERKLKLPTSEEGETHGKMESYSELTSWKLKPDMKLRIASCVKLAKKHDIEMRKLQKKNDYDLFQNYMGSDTKNRKRKLN